MKCDVRMRRRNTVRKSDAWHARRQPEYKVAVQVPYCTDRLTYGGAPRVREYKLYARWQHCVTGGRAAHARNYTRGTSACTAAANGGSV
eukprot:IDg21015t1